MNGRVFPRPYQLVNGRRRPVRGSKWYYEFAVQRDGKRRFISEGGFATRAAAENALRDALHSHRGGGSVRQLPSGRWQARIPGSDYPTQRLSLGAFDDEATAQRALEEYNAGCRIVTISAGDLMGIEEAARELGFTAARLRKLIGRSGSFVAPFAELTGGPVFLRSDVELWGSAHNRGWLPLFEEFG